MIAIITSCIHPANTDNDQPRSHIDVLTRENQTIESIKQLQKFNFSQLILVDNSIDNYDFSKIAQLFKDLKIVRFKQYQFENKGINELMMLLAIVDELPDEQPIFKISGRYYPIDGFTSSFDPNYDFKVRGYNFHQKTGSISTRGYFVKNKQLYKEFLVQVFNEVFLYPQRIVGIKSLFAQFSSMLKPIFKPLFNTSIEFASARVLKHNNYKIALIEKLNIAGIVAGSSTMEKLSE